MKTKKKTQTYRGLNVLVWQEDDLFVAKTVEIELASQGKTKKEALQNLEEALELYFEDEKINPTLITPLAGLELHRLNCSTNSYPYA